LSEGFLYGIEGQLLFSGGDFWIERFQSRHAFLLCSIGKR
jgi:hypothetical protein